MYYLLTFFTLNFAATGNLQRLNAAFMADSCTGEWSKACTGAVAMLPRFLNLQRFHHLYTLWDLLFNFTELKFKMNCSLLV